MSLPRFCACTGALLFSATAVCAAAAPRTYVASNGNDAHPCSRPQPCRSFATAISHTDPGGEVIVLDSAGYGGVTISKSVSITAPSGIYAGISVFSGDGITVDGSNVVVALRGLTINGQGGNYGIRFAQGAELAIEDCRISRLNVSAINAQAANGKITVTNTSMRNNGTAGFEAYGSLDAALDRVHSSGNAVGASAFDGSRVTISNSVLANNPSAGAQAMAFSSSGGTVADLMVTRSTIAGAGSGLVVGAFTGNTARLVSDRNAINNFTSAFAFATPAAGTEIIYSAGNNTVGFGSYVIGGPFQLTPCCSN